MRLRWGFRGKFGGRKIGGPNRFYGIQTAHSLIGVYRTDRKKWHEMDLQRRLRKAADDLTAMEYKEPAE